MWLPWGSCDKMKPFIYLIQADSANPYPEMNHPSCDRIILARREGNPPEELNSGTIFAPQASWTEGRNRLLWQALEQARTSGHDYLYYIFLDDNCILSEDEQVARELGVTLTGNPFRTFERFLLEWEPAVGSTSNKRERDNGRHQKAKEQADILSQAIDGLPVAYHRETLSFLLPYYTGFDSESRLYSQYIIDRMTSLLYPSHGIQCNLVNTTIGRDKDYGPRKKYWEIPATFLAAALRPALRKVLGRQVSSGTMSASGLPCKKNHSYHLSRSYIASQWHTGHPLLKYRRLDAIMPRPMRSLTLQQPTRIAVCLSGSCRGLDRTNRNLQENLFNELGRYGQYDIFMYVPEDAEAGHAALLNPTVLRVVPDHHLAEDGLRNGRDCLLKVGLQRYLQQLYGLKMCDQLRQAYEKDNEINYDAVLRCRPDLLFESPLPDLKTLDLNYIHVPDFHMFEGCNDRFAIGNPEDMARYMNKYDDWPAYVRSWIGSGPQAPPVTAEMFTAGQLRRYGIPVRLMPVRFNRVRVHKIESDWQDHYRKMQRRRKNS